jgi:hypothetical protein
MGVPPVRCIVKAGGTPHNNHPQIVQRHFFSSPHPTSSHVNCGGLCLCSEFYSPRKLGGNTLDTAYSRFMKYSPETGFLYSSRIITDSVARNPVSRDLHLHGICCKSRDKSPKVGRATARSRDRVLVRCHQAE